MLDRTTIWVMIGALTGGVDVGARLETSLGEVPSALRVNRRPFGERVPLCHAPNNFHSRKRRMISSNAIS